MSPRERSLSKPSLNQVGSLEGQVITAIPATPFIWVIGTGVAMLTADPA